MTTHVRLWVRVWIRVWIRVWLWIRVWIRVWLWGRAGASRANGVRQPLNGDIVSVVIHLTQLTGAICVLVAHQVDDQRSRLVRAEREAQLEAIGGGGDPRAVLVLWQAHQLALAAVFPESLNIEAASGRTAGRHVTAQIQTVVPFAAARVWASRRLLTAQVVEVPLLAVDVVRAHAGYRVGRAAARASSCALAP